MSAGTGGGLSLGCDFGDPRGSELQGGVDGADDEVAVGRGGVDRLYQGAQSDVCVVELVEQVVQVA